MSDLTGDKSWGVLRDEWTANINDYALAGGWCQGSKTFLAGGAEGGLHAFDAKSGTPTWINQSTHDGGLLALSIHPHGTSFATAGQDGRVLIWSAAKGELLHASEVGSSWVEHLSWSPDGKFLAAACGKQVTVLYPTGAEVWRSADHPSTVSAVAWSPKRELATACYGQVAFFAAADGARRQKLEWKGSLVSMVLSPDGDVVACGSQDNSVHFWRRSTGRDSMMSGYSSKPSALAFDVRGTLLATGGGEKITVWNFRRGPEGTEPGVLDLHMKPVTAMAFARTGKQLATTARDSNVVIWQLKKDGTGEPAGAAFLAGAGSGLYWRPDGRALAALDASGAVSVWRTR